MSTSSSSLLGAIPHLDKLAQCPLVIHVSLEPAEYPDYSDITAIRRTGFIFLQSETLQEAQDLALSAHALAFKSGKGVIHFFDASNSKFDDPIESEADDTAKSLLGPLTSGVQRPDGSRESMIYVDEGRQASLSQAAMPLSTDGVVINPLESSSDAPSSSKSRIPSREPSSPSSSGRESSIDSRPTTSSATSIESISTRPVSSKEVLESLHDIWSKLESLTGRAYRPFEYTGPLDADVALFIFGSTGLFVDELRSSNAKAEFEKIGLITARLYQPWLDFLLREVIPESVKRIAVLEQISRRSSKWGPVLLEVLSSLGNDQNYAQRPLIVGHQLGYLEPSTVRQALRGITQNLKSASPIQNLDIGLAKPPHRLTSGHYPLTEPKIEEVYLKILAQTFGDRLHVANRLDASDAGVSSLISASPEYGFGSLLARIERRRRFLTEVKLLAQSKDFTTRNPALWLSKWVLDADNPDRVNSIAVETIERLATDGSRLATELLLKKDLFFKESQWLIGSDAWAYDLGNSGVHHVIASGANVNMLVIDSQPYSEGAPSDPLRRKKDIGLYAMNFGNAYVASVAAYGSYTHTLEVMIAADKFDGPSVVIAYLPYSKEDDSPLAVLQRTKTAIDQGYWPLYQWNPLSEPNFELKSEKIKKELDEFLQRDNRLSQLTKRVPSLATNISVSQGSELRTIQKRTAKEAYERMVESLYGAPLTIIFASDNGNAETLAKRLGNRARVRGLKSMVMAMDDYPVEDLSGEENVVFITSTAGQGEFPQNGRAFWDSVKDNGELDLSSTKYAVFALGDSHYWPRKEDKIYYNKPGKDLDARISFLGGKRLIDAGLGDDQDPDGFQTGYAQWEPRIWEALGVANVEGLPEEPPPITNEDIKLESNYLRGTIAEGLEDSSTGAISASDQQLTKFHGTYMQDDRDLRDQRKAQGLEPAYSFMIRCRLNGGVATPSQWLQMDAISTEYGNETMKLTTRQTFQFHGVIKGKLKPAMRAINKALMTTLAACGDVNRNVMVSTLPTKSAFHKDVHAVSAQIADHLLPATTAYHEIWIKDEDDKKVQVAGNAIVDQEPLYGPQYLPRKFKITIAVPPHNDTDVYAHDIGMMAIKNEEGRLKGFNYLVGGGMGVTHSNKKTYPRTGSMLGYVAADQSKFVCEKIMLVQKDNGDRKNRKHARLKYTVDDMGVDIFRAKVEDLLGFQFEEAKPFEFASNIDTFGWQRDETGMNHFTMFIENGRVEDTPDFQMKTGLREIAKVHKGEFRLTGNQHLCLSNVHDSDVTRIKTMLKNYQLDNYQFSGLRLSSSACVAFPTCGLAMAESERYLPKLITLLEDCLEENGLRHDSIVMRMTGCPNGCARPWLAEVAFVGKAYGTYNMYLGGGYHGQRLNKLYRSSIQEEEILGIMKPMLGRYARERKEEERFGDFVIRVGIIKPTTEGKTFHEEVAELESEDEA